jgi:hypothetical protein
MADEAFALSPISARAAQPNEQDYDAISEAFMETARGRWFLGEYAKRNRNADTRMVLDAVARIEQTLAAQKQPEPAPVVDNGLAEAVEAIKAALHEAKAAASAAIDNLALEQHLAPVRKGARVIREISWRWREIGADSRICDLIDSQVSAIEASCGELATADPHGELSAAFDLIGRRIAAFDDGHDATEQVVVESTASAQAAPAEQAVAIVEAVAEMTVEAADVSAVVADPAPQTTNAEAAAFTEPEMSAEAVAEIAAAESISDEAADAEDNAMLDLIAAEMSAPDVSDAHLVDEAEPPPAEPAMIAPVEELTVAPEMAPAIEPSVPVALQPARELPAERMPEPVPQPEPEPSIGSTLLAGGLLKKQGTNDPLAALRRLSQAEKIALFS